MAKSLALGTIFSVEIATVWTPIGNLTNVGVPGATKGETDVTDFDSTAREFLGTLADNGEMPFSGWFNYANAGQLALYTDANDPAAPTRNFRVDFTRQNVRFTFAGFVKSFVPNAGGVDDAYTFDGSIRVSGAVTDTTPIP